jgi:Domain of unknown function (DUF4160)
VPTIYVNGFQIRVIPGDHNPAHVHVEKSGGEAVFIIKGSVVMLREQRGMKAAELRHAAQAAASVYERLQALWKESCNG